MKQIADMTRQEKINFIIEGLEKLGMANLEKLKQLKAHACKEGTECIQPAREAQAQKAD